jgi:hypothetical protein
VSRRVRAARAAFLLALALGSTASAAPADGAEATPSERLEITARSWSFEGRPLALRVETRGALAERPADLLVFVDDRHVADARAEGGVARLEIPASALASGRRRILVKSGSERAWLEVKVLPGSWLWAGGALLVLAAGSALLARRKRR